MILYSSYYDKYADVIPIKTWKNKIGGNHFASHQPPTTKGIKIIE